MCLESGSLGNIDIYQVVVWSADQRGEGVMIKKSKSASSKVGGGQAKYGTGFRRGNDLLNYRIGGNGIPGSRTNIGHILSSVERFAKTEEELMA